MPSIEEMLVTKIDIWIACERKKTIAPVMATATKPRLSGSSAAATRAEDQQQHDEDDREADALGLLEVLLGEVLHAGPQGLQADEVDRDTASSPLRMSAFLRIFAAASAV